MPSYNSVNTLSTQLTVDTNAYQANDVVGGLLTIPVAHSGFVVRDIVLIDDDNEGAALELYLFDAAPGGLADDVAFAPAIADLLKLRAQIIIATTDYITLSSNKWVYKSVNVDFDAPSGNLYAYLVCTATPTYAAASSLTLNVTVWNNYG